MIRILGVRVDQVNMEDSLCKIKDFIVNFRTNRQSAHIVTINPEGIWLAKNDPELFEIIERADLVTADGNGVLWAAAKQGQPLSERVTGIDLIQRICALAVQNSWSVYLLGAKEGVAAGAGDKLVAAYPGLQISGADNGYFREREAKLVADIAAAGPDILFAALGMPFQEKWLAAHKNSLNCGVMIGVGGSFDVIAGLVRRAPHWVQKSGFEWLWRLLADPKRWRRSLIIPKFIFSVNQNKIKNNSG